MNLLFDGSSKTMTYIQGTDAAFSPQFATAIPTTSVGVLTIAKSTATGYSTICTINGAWTTSGTSDIIVFNFVPNSLSNYKFNGVDTEANLKYQLDVLINGTKSTILLGDFVLIRDIGGL